MKKEGENMKKIIKTFIDITLIIALCAFMLSICMLDSENYIMIGLISLLSMIYLGIITSIRERR